MESESLIDPPGWTMDSTPISFAVSIPSLNGKNASDIIMEPFALSPALLAAILTASTRLVCPGPTPTVAKPVFVVETSNIALDLTSEITAVPNLANMISDSVNSFFVTLSIEFQSIFGGPCV